MGTYKTWIVQFSIRLIAAALARLTPAQSIFHLSKTV